MVTVTATATGEQILHAGRRRRVATLAAPLHGLTAADLALLDRAAALMEGLSRAVAGLDGSTESAPGTLRRRALPGTVHATASDIR